MLYVRLQQYQFKLKHHTGKTNPANVLSRQRIKAKSKEIAGEVYINFVATNAVPKSMEKSEIEEASQKDKVIQEVIAAVQSGQWKTSKLLQNSEVRDLRALFQLPNELSVNDNRILLRGRQIVIPQSLRQRTVSIAHESHQGIVKTKMLLRTKVWWPGMDRQVESLVAKCTFCQATNNRRPPEPLRMTKMPAAHGTLFVVISVGHFPRANICWFSSTNIRDFRKWPS